MDGDFQRRMACSRVLNTSQRDGLDLHTPASPEGCFKQAEIRLLDPCCRSRTNPSQGWDTGALIPRTL